MHWIFLNKNRSIVDKNGDFLLLIVKNCQNIVVYQKNVHNFFKKFYLLAKIGADAPLFATRTKLCGLTDRRTDTHSSFLK